MASNIKSSTTKTTKQLAQQAAKQIADESIEGLKEGRKQLTGVELNVQQNQPVSKNGVAEKTSQEVTPQKEAKIKAQSKRQMQALEKEIEDIRREKEEKKIQEVKAQEEQKRMEEEQAQQEGVIEPTSKRKSNILKGMKGKVAKLQIKSETRMPPSG